MTTSTLQRERVALRKLLWVAPLTIIVTAIANLIIGMIAVSVFGVSEAFQNFQIPALIGSSIFFALAALLAFVLVNRFARSPIRFYRRLAVAALCVSFLSPIMALSSPASVPGMTLTIFWTMLAMHLVSAIIITGLFTTLARE